MEKICPLMSCHTDAMKPVPCTKDCALYSHSSNGCSIKQGVYMVAELFDEMRRDEQ